MKEASIFYISHSIWTFWFVSAAFYAAGWTPLIFDYSQPKEGAITNNNRRHPHKIGEGPPTARQFIRIYYSYMYRGCPSANEGNLHFVRVPFSTAADVLCL